MKYGKQIKTVLISSYSPQWCRIAAFTSRLVRNMDRASGGCFEPTVVAIQVEADSSYSQKADLIIRKDLICDYMEAADFINSGGFDMVLLQHEFGLFGGEGGVYIALLLKRLNIPIITTLHTVLEKPEQSSFQSMAGVCDCSRKVIVTKKHDISVLRNLYGVSESKIEWIPQGVSAVSFVGKGNYQRKFDPQSSEVTWSDVGRVYWKLVKTQSSQTVRKRRFEYVPIRRLNTAPAELAEILCPPA
jgi:hypothetical protein